MIEWKTRPSQLRGENKVFWVRGDATDALLHKNLISVANRVWYHQRFTFLLLLCTLLSLSIFFSSHLSFPLGHLSSSWLLPFVFVLFLSSHCSLLFDITHPACTSHPISPSLTPNLFLLLSSLHLVAPAALAPFHTSIFPPFWLLCPFVFHRISSVSHHLFTVCLVSRAAKVSLTCTCGCTDRCTDTHTYNFMCACQYILLWIPLSVFLLTDWTFISLFLSFYFFFLFLFLLSLSPLFVNLQTLNVIKVNVV